MSPSSWKMSLSGTARGLVYPLPFPLATHTPEERDSVIQMNPEAGNNDRSAIAVEARIVDKGEQGGEIEAAMHMGRVVGFAYALTSILQAAVAEHKAQASQAQVLAMVLAQATVDESRTNAIELSAPGVPCQITAKGNRVVHLAEDKGLVVSIVPPRAEENAEIRR